MVVDAQADVKQVPFGVVQNTEIHRHTKVHALGCNKFKLLLFLAGGVSPDCQAAAGSADCQQVPGQISAVYCGHISRLKHLQGLSLVPVKQVPFMFGHFVYGVKGGLQPRNHVPSADPAKLARAGHRQQIHADVGRRCAVGQRGLGVYLQVVWRQKIVCRGDAIFKKAPGVAGYAREVSALIGTKALCLWLACGQADPPG